MKRTFTFSLVFVLAVFFPGSVPAQEKIPAPSTVKILTVGNSFADNSLSFFPQIAASTGKTVHYFRANLGGCSLERHVRHLQAYEADPKDPEGSPYASSFFPARNEPATRKYSLREALQVEAWDYVTIQQVSTNSYKPETFEPYAGTLIAYIRQYAPRSKIVILQTWAYREDSPVFKEGFTQQKMYEGLAQNYEKLAADYKLQIIPVGFSFQMARGTDRWHFKYPDPDFNYKNPPAGQVPAQPGSLNIGWIWKKPPEKEQVEFVLDDRHGNDAGKLLAGSVFYEAFLGDATKTSFVPKNMTPKDADDLRRLAHEGFASYPGTKISAPAPSP